MPAEFDGLTFLRRINLQLGIHPAANCIVVVCLHMKSQRVIDFFDQHQTVYGVFILPQLLNAGTFFVKFILYFPDNLFHDVFKSNHT
ncbi:hypothetical protein D3C80_1424990 [compost metagenome]